MPKPMSWDQVIELVSRFPNGASLEEILISFEGSRKILRGRLSSESLRSERFPHKVLQLSSASP